MHSIYQKNTGSNVIAVAICVQGTRLPRYIKKHRVFGADILAGVVGFVNVAEQYLSGGTKWRGPDYTSGFMTTRLSADRVC